MALDEVFAYFRKWDRASFEVFACQGNEPTEADVAAFEAVTGKKHGERTLKVERAKK